MPVRSSARPAFRFEAGWIHEEECEMVVENAWKLTMEARERKVADAVREGAAELHDWSRNTLGDLEKRIKHARRELEACRRGAITRDSVGREEILKY